MRAIRIAGFIGLCLSLLLPMQAAGRSSEQPGNDVATASHLGGALLLCGQVTEFTAPDGVATDGAMTMTGVSDPDPHAFVIAATAVITPADAGLLTALAGTDSFTCLDAVGDGLGVLVEAAILPSAQFCGTVDTAGTTWRLTDMGFPDLSTTLSGDAEAILDADVRLDDLLAWFDQFDGEACLTFTTGPTGAVIEITLDGELTICGAVADTSASVGTAVLEYAADLAVRPDIVSIGGVTLSASLFTDAALGLLELAYAAQSVPGYSGTADVCAVVPVVTTELLPASLIAADPVIGRAELWLDGWITPNGIDTIGLADAPDLSGRSWSALLFDGLLGYRVAPPSPDAPNFTKALTFGESEFLASVIGGAGDERIHVMTLHTTCATVVAKSADAITLRERGESEAYTFTLSEGSAIDWRLVPGTTVMVGINAAVGTHFGPGRPIPDNYVDIHPIDPNPTCTVGAPDDGGLPDTALGVADVGSVGAIVGGAGLFLLVLSAGAVRGRRRR